MSKQRRKAGKQADSAQSQPVPLAGHGKATGPGFAIFVDARHDPRLASQIGFWLEGKPHSLIRLYLPILNGKQYDFAEGFDTEDFRADVVSYLIQRRHVATPQEAVRLTPDAIAALLQADHASLPGKPPTATEKRGRPEGAGRRARVDFYRERAAEGLKPAEIGRRLLRDVPPDDETRRKVREFAKGMPVADVLALNDDDEFFRDIAKRIGKWLYDQYRDATDPKRKKRRDRWRD